MLNTVTGDVIPIVKLICWIREKNTGTDLENAAKKR
jgi:hypothetical protein